MTKTVRITCSCDTCNGNAATLGLGAPLAAEVPAALARKVGKQTHALVYDAHGPSPISAAVRKATGIRPVTA